MSLSFHHVTFTHENAPAPMLENVTAHFPIDWTCILGANGTGKSMLPHLAEGDLPPCQGSQEIDTRSRRGR